MLNANLWLANSDSLPIRSQQPEKLSCLFFSEQVGRRRPHPKTSSSYPVEFSNGKVLPCFLHTPKPEVGQRLRSHCRIFAMAITANAPIEDGLDTKQQTNALASTIP